MISTNIPQFSGNQHNTDIGSLSTNIHFEENLLRFTVGGTQVMSFQTNPAAGGVVTEYSTLQYVNSKTVNTLANQSADYNCQGYKIINLANPINQQDAVTKNYVDTVTQTSRQIMNPQNTNCYLQAGLNKLTNGTTQLDMNTQQIINLGNPQNNTDAVNKLYVDSSIAQLVVSSGGNQITNSINNQSRIIANQTELTNGSTPLNMNSQKITLLQNPTAPTDAATKQYVDSMQGDSYRIVSQLDNASKLIANELELTNGSTPLNMNSQNIKNIQNPINTQDAVSKNYCDNTTKGKIVNSAQTNSSLTASTTQIVNGSTPLNMNSQSIINLQNPVNSTDAATKQYIDSLLSNNYKKMLTMSLVYNGGDINPSYTNGGFILRGDRTNVQEVSGYVTCQAIMVDNTNCELYLNFQNNPIPFNYIPFIQARGMREANSGDNDFWPIITRDVQLNGFKIYIEQINTSYNRIQFDILLVQTSSWLLV